MRNSPGAAHIAYLRVLVHFPGPMLRQLLKRIVPAPHSLQDRWFVRLFGERISDPLLWTLHRRGVTYAFGAGLAICFIPLPVHLLTACTIAMVWRLNIPVVCGTDENAFKPGPIDCSPFRTAVCVVPHAVMVISPLCEGSISCSRR